MEPAMDLFPDGGFVWMPSRERSEYIYADEDADGVSLRRLGAVPSINAVWKSEYWFVEGAAAPFLLLQGAAYGRYLAVTNQMAPVPHRGFRAVQRDYNSPNLDPRFVWSPFRIEDEDQEYALLSNWGRLLRANGVRNNLRPCPYPWMVTAHGNLNTMSHWAVEAIPLSPVPITLPPPPPPRLFSILDVIAGHPEPAPLRRVIRYARVNDEGDIDQDLVDCPNFSFDGRSVFNLRTQVGLRQNDCNIFGITLCVRAGLNALPIPLITDLPQNQNPLDTIVYKTISQGAAGLAYTHFDAPAP